MKRFILGLLLIAVVAMPGTIEAKKKKTTHKTLQEQKYDHLSALERKIVGKHMLSLQWISWESFGEVTIKKEADGSISCRGEQLARKCRRGIEQGNIDNDDYVKLNGVIDIIDAKHFLFIGEIREKVYHLNNGEEVVRKGTFNFEATGNRKFWRMQEMTHPTDECVDYIDIYFK
ncbi:MAG: hypothetical protein IKT03_05005 [Muribaculaceae bacterium]|nr:hypothetical protein [Muribaculaceae bacterium]MBR6489878.1 hypothetical protein [Muribaculaceae bacterium]